MNSHFFVILNVANGQWDLVEIAKVVMIADSCLHMEKKGRTVKFRISLSLDVIISELLYDIFRFTFTLWCFGTWIMVYRLTSPEHFNLKIPFTSNILH